MDSDHDGRRNKLKAAILAHLSLAPLAADTAEGVVECWLSEIGFKAAPQLIDEVLNEMVEQQLLVAHTLPDGKKLYAAVMGPRKDSL